MIQPSPLHRKVSAPPVGPSPIGWWRFEEGAGAIVGDSSSGGHDASLTGYAEEDWSPGAGPGSNYSLLFKNPTIATVGPAEAFNFDITDPFSITFHINFTATSERYVITRMIVADGWGIKATRSGSEMRIQFYLVSEWNEDHLQVLQDLPGTLVGGWTHWAVTYSAATGKASDVSMYVDGSPVTFSVVRDSLSQTTKQAADLVIGRRPAESSSLRAYLDDLRVYDSELSAVQVAQIASEYY